jgi:hypothetical protein
MRIVRLFAMTVACTLGTSVLALAQEHGKAGVTVGYPGDIGILWHASDAIAIRPVFSFSHSSSESATGGGSSGWSTGVGVSALFYLKKYDNVRTYVSPQFTWTHTSAEITPTLPSQGTAAPSVNNSNNGTGGNGAFGVQYTPSPHFGVYGELGIGYAHQKTTFGTTTPLSSKGSTWGGFAGVGVVFYP